MSVQSLIKCSKVWRNRSANFDTVWAFWTFVRLKPQLRSSFLSPQNSILNQNWRSALGKIWKSDFVDWLDFENLAEHYQLISNEVWGLVRGTPNNPRVVPNFLLQFSSGKFSWWVFSTQYFHLLGTWEDTPKALFKPTFVQRSRNWYLII